MAERVGPAEILLFGRMGRIGRCALLIPVVHSPRIILNLLPQQFILLNNHWALGRCKVTQTQVTAHLADKIGISKKQAKSALDEFNEYATRQLKKEGSLRLAGLGVFRKRKLKARMGRNPATGEQITIPPPTPFAFPPPKSLK